jgi:hypothetical protein
MSCTTATWWSSVSIIRDWRFPWSGVQDGSPVRTESARISFLQRSVRHCQPPQAARSLWGSPTVTIDIGATVIARSPLALSSATPRRDRPMPTSSSTVTPRPASSAGAGYRLAPGTFRAPAESQRGCQRSSRCRPDRIRSICNAQLVVERGTSRQII